LQRWLPGSRNSLFVLTMKRPTSLTYISFELRSFVVEESSFCGTFFLFFDFSSRSVICTDSHRLHLALVFCFESVFACFLPIAGSSSSPNFNLPLAPLQCVCARLRGSFFFPGLPTPAPLFILREISRRRTHPLLREKQPNLQRGGKWFFIFYRRRPNPSPFLFCVSSLPIHDSPLVRTTLPFFGVSVIHFFSTSLSARSIPHP